MAGSAPQLPENDIEAAAQHPIPDNNAPADGDKRSTSDRYEGQTYEQRLYGCVDSQPDDLRGGALSDFHKLSQVNIQHLRNELAKYGEVMVTDKAAPQDIEHVEDLLHRYTTAVQDFQYWSSLPRYGMFWGIDLLPTLQQSFPDIYNYEPHIIISDMRKLPKSTSASIDPLRSFLKRVLPKELTWTNEERTSRSAVDYLSHKTPETLSPFVDTLARFIVAITGGLSLVVPMLVMRLGETLPKSLTTVSVAVILFSALTSLMFKASNVETLAATAAYAAVLVVFVGTSS